MKSIKYSLIVFFVLFLTVNTMQAQDKRTLDTKIADLLAQMPANDTKQLNKQMNNLLKLGEEGQQKILFMVIPPGTGDDTKARFAVESMSRFLSQPDKVEHRIAWEALILKEVEKAENTDEKMFFISQLNYIGGDATVEKLSKYLTDKKLHAPAIRAMRDANQKVAAKTFADYLKKTSGKQQIALVNAIKELGFSEHTPAVSALSGSTNIELQRSVLMCLAKLGSPDSYSILMEAAEKADFMPEAIKATNSLLAYAQVLSDNKNNKLSLKICKIVLKKCTDEEQIHFKIAALLISAGNDKIKKSVSLLTDAMKSDNKQYRMAAINYAAKENSPVDQWIATIRKTKSKEVEGEILYLFGLLRNKKAADVVKEYLKDTDANARMQAVQSLALIQKGDAVNDILDYTLLYPTKPDTKAAKNALLIVVNKDNVKQLVDKINDAPDGAKVVLLEVIAAKRDPAHFTVLFDHTKSKGQVRKTALKNLHKVVTDENLNDLLNLFDKLEDKTEIKYLEKALITSANSSDDKTKTTLKILKSASEKSSIDKYIGVLAGVGSKEALKAVLSQYKLGSATSQKAALNALLNWSDDSATSALFDVCSGDNAKADKEMAFESYINLVSKSKLTDDQKLLLIRKIEPYAPDIKAKQQLIKAVGNVKTFLSFIFTSKYLDDKDLQVDAANSLVKIVLPSKGKNNGFSGAMVKDYLNKSKELISGRDSEYIKINIENHLKEMPDQVGFVSMFNGKDLSGWQGLAANPKKKKKLTKKELKKLQAEANIKMLENWSVRDNSIVFNGKGANLCSVKEYGSFEMHVDWRITKKGDSGIYLRGTPQIQIWDTSRVEVGAQVGSGGLYNNKKHESKPLMVADNPIGDWNTFRITMIGDRVTVYLNGRLVVDNVVMDNYWDRNSPIFPTGSIELQAHGTDLAFRDIYINDLKSTEYNLTEEEKTEGFVALFNGKDLSGWVGNHNYKVEDGNIVMSQQGRGGNLYTEKEYSDFIYRFDFKLTPGANNGLGIRTPLEGDAAYVGYELQILDNTAPVYAKLKPYQYHGSVYGIVPAKRGFLKPVGEWNSQEVIVKGDTIKVILNGTTIVDTNMKEATKNGTADGKTHPGLKRKSGHIGYLGHGSVVWFRNIRIKEL